MAKTRKEIYSRAIKVWGRTSQVLQCADVSIMLHEMKELFGPAFVAQVKKIKAEKLARLERRLDAAS